MRDDGKFEVLRAEEMQNRYGMTAENRPIIMLDAANVPVPLRHLIPLASKFGISDDLIRADVTDKAPAADVEELRRVVQAHDDLLDEWLAGPAALGPTFSEEYIAFTCMRMAADGC